MAVAELIPLDVLLQTVNAGGTDDGPCGPDLVDDMDFVNFLQEAQGKGDQAGDGGDEWADPAVETKRWRTVLRQGTLLLGRSKDLQTTIYICFASVRLGGLAGLRQGLTLIDEMIGRYWDDVHPRHDPDDEYPIQRINAVSELNGARFLRMVRWSRLVQSGKYGTCTIRDVLVATGELQPVSRSGEGTDAEQVERTNRALRDVADQDAEAFAAAVSDVKQCADLVAKIVARQTEHVGPQNAADLSGLQRMMDVVHRYVVGNQPITAAPESAPSNQNGVNVPTAPPAVTGEIQTRDDVIVLLNKICDFYKRTEPASPVPLLLTRAKKLVKMSFLDIIKDLSPGALDDVQRISGTTGDGESAG